MDRVHFPVVAGHEGVGEVVAAGSMATSVKLGDKGNYSERFSIILVR